MAHYDPKDMAEALGRNLLAFPITPYNSNLDLDLSAYRAHLSWMLQFKPAGIFAAGGTGEFFSLSPAEIADITTATVEEVGGRVPVLAGVGYGRGIALDMARGAETAGADGILLLPPYLVSASQEGLADHIEAVCRATDLGVIVYNRDNAIVTADTLARLCERCPNLVGYKDGVGDLELMVRIENKIGDRLLYVGGLPTAELFALPYLTMGVTTYSSALFNFLPNFAVSFYEAVRRQDLAAISKGLREFVLPYTAIRNRGKGYAVSIVKAGAEMMGRASGALRPPLTQLDERSARDLAELLERFGDTRLELADAAE
ncbi:MAG TPA: 5-dehydro-4-deoxyglucarate dehydratase [Devosiaceae bacterium]|jgi:5-dehydro-4-deoxyglucarate dehydratase|nr:5-dehydro-4-deoxyglucarate dehydratase [Devosiaceae bacterium]